MSETKPRLVIELSPAGPQRPGEPDFWMRCRRLLKDALRRHGLRASWPTTLDLHRDDANGHQTNAGERSDGGMTRTPPTAQKRARKRAME